MEVFCSHSNRAFNKASNYSACRLCLSSWYGIDPIPIVIIGYTDELEVDVNYLDRFEEKDLSKKKFTRCQVCKDLLEKRKHRICNIKAFWKEIGKRHIQTVSQVLMVIKGFKKDK